jgi:hypothetical protein
MVKGERTKEKGWEAGRLGGWEGRRLESVDGFFSISYLHNSSPLTFEPSALTFKLPGLQASWPPSFPAA